MKRALLLLGVAACTAAPDYRPPSFNQVLVPPGAVADRRYYVSTLVDNPDLRTLQIEAGRCGEPAQQYEGMSGTAFIMRQSTRGADTLCFRLFAEGRLADKTRRIVPTVLPGPQFRIEAPDTVDAGVVFHAEGIVGQLGCGLKYITMNFANKGGGSLYFDEPSDNMTPAYSLDWFFSAEQTDSIRITAQCDAVVGYAAKQVVVR